MPIFTRSGPSPKDCWLVDGSPNFGIFPAGLLAQIDAPTSIWLKVGNVAFGETHINERHGHWVARQLKTVPQLVFEKLGQPGHIYCTESEKKVKVSLRIAPSSLLVLELVRASEVHFSVTSLYAHPAQLDGQVMGRYRGR